MFMQSEKQRTQRALGPGALLKTIATVSRWLFLVFVLGAAFYLVQSAGGYWVMTAQGRLGSNR